MLRCEIFLFQIFCAKCGSKDMSADDDIILCDGACDRGFHLLCLEPPLLKEESNIQLIHLMQINLNFWFLNQLIFRIHQFLHLCFFFFFFFFILLLLSVLFCLALIIAVPPDDEGWLCPACDCKVDCMDLLNDSQETKLSVTDSWEVIYKISSFFLISLVCFTSSLNMVSFPYAEGFP